MGKHFSFLGTKRRLTELLVSESGAVDVQKAMGVGAVVTGSVLAAMLLAPGPSEAAGPCDPNPCLPGWKCCEDGVNFKCCGALQTCSGGANCA